MSAVRPTGTTAEEHPADEDHPAADEPQAAHRSSDDRRWRLEDQRDFLLRSLADLRLELDAGDIEPRDYEALVVRDQGRLSAVEAELLDLDIEEAAAPDPATDAQPVAPARSRRRPLWLAVIATVALTAGITLLVIHLASPRLPGQPETGSITQNLTQEVQTQLAEASALVDQGTQSSLAQALTVYRTVLTEDPDQPQALAETGWLEWEAGYSVGDSSLETTGKGLVQRSLKVEPNDYAAHLFLGTIELNQDHDPAAAVIQYDDFLSEHPPTSLITQAASLIKQADEAVGRPVPAAVGG